MTQLVLLPGAGPACICGHLVADHNERGLCPWCACSAKAPTAPAPGPRQTRAAAQDQITRAAPNLRRRVMAALLAAGAAGLTSEEIEARTGLGGNTVRPRLVELREEGRVMRAPAVRPTRSGRCAVVWVAAPSEVAP